MNWEAGLIFVLCGICAAALAGLIFKWYFQAKLEYVARIVMAVGETLEKVKQLRRKEADEKCSTSSK